MSIMSRNLTFEQICERIQSNDPTITVVEQHHLCRCCYDDECQEDLLMALKDNTQVSKLEIFLVRSTDADLDPLLDYVGTTQTIRAIRLYQD
jgi:hypothetical protein